MGKTVLRAVVLAGVVVLGGCAGNGLDLSGSTEDEGIEGCSQRVVKGITTDLERVNYVIQDCLGKANSPQAKVARTHAAILMIANYGARSINAFQADDPEHATADALLLKHRVVKAVKKLESIRNNPSIGSSETKIQKVFPKYRPLSLRERGDVQLYGVVRAALAPAVRRTKGAVRSYIRAATGGAAGVLAQVFRRREAIKKKIYETKKTIRLAEAAISDTQCLLLQIDINHGQATAPANSKCPTGYPGNLDFELKEAINTWLTETLAKLDEVANAS